MIFSARAGEDERRRSPWYRGGRYVNLDEDASSDGSKVLAFLKWRVSAAERPAPVHASVAQWERQPAQTRSSAGSTPARGTNTPM